MTFCKQKSAVLTTCITRSVHKSFTTLANYTQADAVVVGFKGPANGVGLRVVSSCETICKQPCEQVANTIPARPERPPNDDQFKRSEI